MNKSIPKNGRKLRKKLKFGIEFELFTLDENGYMTEGADRLINRVKKEHPEIEIKRECGKNMVEIITSPQIEVPDAMLKALEDFEAVAACASEEKLILYAYGTYPGAFIPEFYANRRLNAKQKIIGKQRFAIAGRCIGLHIHYSLPWGVFDSLQKVVKPLIRSKNIRSMVNIYNLCIAMDPALTALAQSSPFYQGGRLGKDARVIVYRGGGDLDYSDGLYANLPDFGALQNYKSTNTDILHLIKERFLEWGGLLKKLGYSIVTLSKHGSILDNTWNPVRISSHGTMEIRGMDMNHPDIVTALAVVIRFIIKAVQEKFLNVVPSDIGATSPFTREGNVIYIPPDSLVRTVLQRKSAYEGLASDEVRDYCASLLKLAKEFIPENRLPLLKSLEDMLENRRTSSDRIIKKAEDLGIATEGEMSPAQAAALAFELSNDLYNEILITKENLKQIK